MADLINVNIAPLWSDNEADIGATDHQIWNALQTTGAITISQFPGAGQIDHWARTGTAIHDASDAIKDRLTIAVYHAGNPNYYRGYHPKQPGSPFKVNLFDIGPEHPAAGPELPGIDYMVEPTPWPTDAELPNWQATMRECYHTLNSVSQKLILSIGRAAGFDSADILQRFDGEHSTLRMLDYPELDPSESEGIAGHRHVDAAGLSLLWQREPGLQAEGPDGEFFDVPMIDNCLSVHVGTVLESMTDGKIRATPHRVLGRKGQRRSMGFFLEPALNASVRPVATPQSDTPVDETYGWLLLKTHHGRDKYAQLIPDPETVIERDSS